MPAVKTFRELATATDADLWETLRVQGSNPLMFMSPAPILEELARREAARQTAEIVRLTAQVRNLTIVLAVVGGVSLLAALVAAWAAVVLLQRP